MNNKLAIALVMLSFFQLMTLDVNAQSSEDENKVKETMSAYKKGVESLSTEGLTNLFTKDSEVYESGGNEGTFEHYLGHHLGPELGHFTSFKFNDYKIEAKLDLPFAFTTESYVYKIVLKEDGRVIEKKGIATSVLKKIDGQWKIIKTHSSSRAKKASSH